MLLWFKYRDVRVEGVESADDASGLQEVAVGGAGELERRRGMEGHRNGAGDAAIWA